MSRQDVQLEVPGAVLAGTEWSGPAPPVVLLHAGVCDRRSWYGVGDLLSGTHRVLAYDRRGYGESAVSRTAYRDVDDLLAVCESMNLSAGWLVGSSMGGAVALDAAVLRPELVAGLVLLAPAVTGAPELPEDRLDPASQRLSGAIDEAFETGNRDELVRLETWLWLDGPGADEGRVGGAARALVRDMNGIVAANEGSEHSGSSGMDTWQVLERITQPATIAWGDLDIPLLVDRCRALERRLPRASAHELRDTAHLPYLEDAAAVADLVTAAIDASRV